MCVCLYFSLGEKFLGPEENNSRSAALVTRHGRRRGTKVLSSLLHSILTGEGVLGVIEARRYTAFCLPGQE
jgi:hypothetical protein